MVRIGEKDVGITLHEYTTGAPLIEWDDNSTRQYTPTNVKTLVQIPDPERRFKICIKLGSEFEWPGEKVKAGETLPLGKGVKVGYGLAVLVEVDNNSVFKQRFVFGHDCAGDLPEVEPLTKNASDEIEIEIETMLYQEYHQSKLTGLAFEKFRIGTWTDHCLFACLQPYIEQLSIWKSAKLGGKE